MAQIAARVTDEEKEELELYCQENDIKLSQLIRKAVKEYVAKRVDDSDMGGSV